LKKLVLFAVLCSVILLLMPMVNSVETKLVEETIEKKYYFIGCNCENVKLFNNNATICWILQFIYELIILYGWIFFVIPYNIERIIEMIGRDWIPDEFWDKYMDSIESKLALLLNLSVRFDC